MKDISLSDALRTELNRRITKNSNYSLRSFAKALEVDPSHLSRILSGKRNISYPLAKRICEKLGINEEAAEPLRPQFSWDKRTGERAPVHFILELAPDELTQEKIDAVIQCLRGEFPAIEVEVRK